MSITYKNPTPCRITFRDVEKEGRILDHDGVLQVAFFGSPRELRRVSTVQIDGVEHAIVGEAEKGDIAGTVRMTVQRTGG